MSPVRGAGIVVAAAGGVAVVIGGVVALAAKSSYDSVADGCPAAGCTRTAFDVRQNARDRADAATAVMVAGGALLAGGLLMIVLAPDTPSVPRIGLGAGRVGLSLSFD